MTDILLVILVIVLLIRWIYLREKFQHIENRFEELQAAIRRAEWARTHQAAEAPRTSPVTPPAPVGPPVATPASETAFGPPRETTTQGPPAVVPPLVTPRPEDFLV